MHNNLKLCWLWPRVESVCSQVEASHGEYPYRTRRDVTEKGSDVQTKVADGDEWTGRFQRDRVSSVALDDRDVRLHAQ